MSPSKYPDPMLRGLDTYVLSYIYLGTTTVSRVHDSIICEVYRDCPEKEIENSVKRLAKCGFIQKSNKSYTITDSGSTLLRAHKFGLTKIFEKIPN